MAKAERFLTFRMAALLALLLLALGPARGRADDWDAANQAYDQGKFAEAKGGYEKLVESGVGNANLFYNLGNADFRLGAAGRAILNYQRALALNPRHPEAQANLKLLREQNGAKLLPVSWGSRIAAGLPPNAWTIVAAITAWVLIFSCVFIVLRRRADNFWLWALALFSVVVAGMAGGALWSVTRDQTLAIITAKQVEARLAPAQSAGVAEPLTAGSQVRVLSERGDWVYCELPGLGRGWIPQGAVERVRPARS